MSLEIKLDASELDRLIKKLDGSPEVMQAAQQVADALIKHLED